MSNDEDTQLIKTGDVWYVKIHDTLDLKEVKVSDVTVGTVSIYGRHNMATSEISIRYKKQDVEFVELIGESE